MQEIETSKDEAHGSADWLCGRQPTDLVPGGTVLESRYQVEEMIGRGGNGIVYKATHLGLRRPVALKMLLAGRAKSARRLRREGMTACRVEHPNAIEVLDFCVLDSGDAFLVLEYLQGHTLDVELARCGALPITRCGEILSTLCSVLVEAHSQGIVHLDIKPHNVFLHRARREEVIKVLDFGLARMFDEGDLARSQDSAEGLDGTPAYVAPERFVDQACDASADVYSLGVMAYEMLTGRRPFIHPTLVGLMRAHLFDEPTPPSALRPGLSPALDAAVLAALAKDPEDRPSAADLASEFATTLRLGPSSVETVFG